MKGSEASLNELILLDYENLANNCAFSRDRNLETYVTFPVRRRGEELRE